jgi:hypothetical protein
VAARLSESFPLSFVLSRYNSLQMSLRPSTFDEALKLIGALCALLSFVWGVWVWRDQSIGRLRQTEAENERLAESRRVEATKPFLERQLKLYTEAAQVAALIATSSDASIVAISTDRFWQLYWGELALVDNREVEGAMYNYGEALGQRVGKDTLQQLSLDLAKACRRSLDRSWGINAWTNPDQAGAKAAVAPASP